MDIHTATRKYEAWVAAQTPLIAEDLELKHKRMAEAPFLLFRGTFYRWAQLWPRLCPALATAADTLAVGDLHIENFGTWRDSEGRLIWGINDFDEAALMPYTIDLTRLATSAILAARQNSLAIGADDACAAILEGYGAGIGGDTAAFVLEQDHVWLRDLAIGGLRDPVKFWAKMRALPDSAIAPPKKVRTWLEEALPESGLKYRLVHRVAGLGSLGRQRYVALAEWRDGSIAREIKALTVSAYAWANGGVIKPKIFYKDVLRHSIRCPDPHLELHGRWLVRRLGPDCSRIDLGSLPKRRNERNLLHAMGRETANVHLRSDGARAIKPDLERRKRKWLVEAATTMADATIADWKAWRR
jgi:hypothetical protein